MTSIALRPWVGDDVPFMWDMLLLSLHIREGQAPFARSVLDRPDIAHYLTDFGGHEGDDAEVCVAGRGERVGAAWVRRTTAAEPGYGFVDEDTPEVGMAVAPGWRQQGIGRLLLTNILGRHPRLSLSVDDENVVAAGLYRSMGFQRYCSADGSTTMLRTG